MNVCWWTSIFSLIQNAIAHIEINGELTFDLKPINADSLKNSRLGDDKKAIGNSVPRSETAVGTTAAIALDSAETEQAVTKDSKIDDCVYKYPERKQLEALQSDLMNRFAKMYIRAYKSIGGHGGRKDRGGRRGSKRFKIANETFDSRFFEEAYNHMAKEYSESANKTVNISRLSSHDPCQRQAEVKRVWRDILRRSVVLLKRAASSCVRELLRVRHRSDDDRARSKLEKLMQREIEEVKTNQLKLLCDSFKLCFKDLL